MPEIKVFTSNGWGPCHMVKVYLSRKGISFAEHNVSIDEDAKNQLESFGRSTTPVTVIGEQLVVGYRPKELDAALAAAGG